MDNVVTSISSAITGDAMWNSFGTVVPLIAAVSIFALGLYFIKRSIKNASKGKGGV